MQKGEARRDHKHPRANTCLPSLRLVIVILRTCAALLNSYTCNHLCNSIFISKDWTGLIRGPPRSLASLQYYIPTVSLSGRVTLKVSIARHARHGPWAMARPGQCMCMCITLVYIYSTFTFIYCYLYGKGYSNRSRLRM